MLVVFSIHNVNKKIILVKNGPIFLLTAVILECIIYIRSASGKAKKSSCSHFGWPQEREWEAPETCETTTKTIGCAIGTQHLFDVGNSELTFTFSLGGWFKRNFLHSANHSASSKASHLVQSNCCCCTLSHRSNNNFTKHHSPTHHKISRTCCLKEQDSPADLQGCLERLKRVLGKRPGPEPVPWLWPLQCLCGNPWRSQTTQILFLMWRITPWALCNKLQAH